MNPWYLVAGGVAAYMLLKGKGKAVAEKRPSSITDDQAAAIEVAYGSAYSNAGVVAVDRDGNLLTLKANDGRMATMTVNPAHFAVKDGIYTFTGSLSPLQGFGRY